MNIILSESNSETPAFFFTGDCYICAKGEGQIQIMRKLGSDFEVLTDETGSPLIFVGDGVIFNSSINCRRKVAHKIVAITPSHIAIDIIKES